MVHQCSGEHHHRYSCVRVAVAGNQQTELGSRSEVCSSRHLLSRVLVSQPHAWLLCPFRILIKNSTCTISFIRIRFLKLTEDFTWDNVETAGWSVGELCCGLTCACLPTFRPLVSRFIPALSSRVTKSSKNRRHDDYSENTASTSRHRDVELGCSSNDTKYYPKRRIESSDSKANLYSIESYDLSHSDSSREVVLPIERHRYDEGDTIPIEQMLSSLQQQEAVTARKHGPDHYSVVETHLEVGHRISDDETKSSSGSPIEIKCDVVKPASSLADTKVFP